MPNIETREMVPDDYKYSGKISNLFSRLAGHELRSAQYLLPMSGQAKYYGQIVARERKDGKWDVIEKTTRYLFTSEGWYTRGPALRKIDIGVSKVDAQQAIKEFEDEHRHLSSTVRGDLRKQVQRPPFCPK